MRANGWAATALGIFNVVSGAFAACIGLLGLLGMAIGGGGSGREVLIGACLPMAGACHALCGGLVVVGARPGLTLAAGLLGLSICFGLVFMGGMTLPAWVEQFQEGGIDSEGLLVFTLVPAFLVLVGGAELAFLALGRERGPHEAGGLADGSRSPAGTR